MPGLVTPCLTDRPRTEVPTWNATTRRRGRPRTPPPSGSSTSTQRGPSSRTRASPTGIDHKPDTPEEQLEPNYARGIAHEDPPGTEHHGRFSEGQEELPETPEKTVERRFSEGIERSPTSE